MITENQPSKKILELQKFHYYSGQNKLEDLRKTVYSQQTNKTQKSLAKQRNQAKILQDQKKDDFYQTTNQSFFGSEFKLNKFKIALEAIQQEQNKQQKDQESQQNVDKKQDSQSQKNSKASTDQLFESMDRNYKIKLFIEKFSKFSYDMILKIINGNFEYFLHFFELCFCYTCDCGFCQCDFVKKNQKNIKYQGGYQTIYGSQFKRKDFDKKLLSFVADKVDHLWSNIPTDYQTTNQKYFQESGNDIFNQLSNPVKIDNNIEKLFKDEIDMRASCYQNQYKDTNKVKQSLDLYKNVNQIPPMFEIKLGNETETNQNLIAKKLEKTKKLQSLEFKVPFARQSNNFTQRIKQSFLTPKHFNQIKNQPIKNSLINLVNNDKIHFQTSRLKQMKDDQNCFQYSIKQKQEIKDILLQKIQQSLKN